MKVLKTSKIIFFLLIISVISFLITIIFFQINPKLDKYEEFKKECVLEKEGFDMYMKCNAFLTRMVQTPEPYSCYDFIIVKDNSSIRETKICEMDNQVNDKDEYLYTELKVPVDLIFKYTRDSLLSYEFKSIEIVHMKKERSIDMLRELKENGIEITSVKITD